MALSNVIINASMVINLKPTYKMKKTHYIVAHLENYKGTDTERRKELKKYTTRGPLNKRGEIMFKIFQLRPKLKLLVIPNIGRRVNIPQDMNRIVRMTVCHNRR